MSQIAPAPAVYTPRRLRVPAEDGALLAVPSLDEARGLIESNSRRISAASTVNLQGRTLEQLREQARSEMLASAFRYTSELGLAVSSADPAAPLIFSGHQPEVFHPGVWVKNAAIDSIARSCGGTAINLVVDNDLCATARVRVPTGSEQRPRITRLSIDQDAAPQPWEERLIRDPELVRSFGPRVTAAMAPWDVQPIAELLWEQLPDCDRTSRLGDILTAVRARFEHTQGLANLELPISRLCSTESFLRFACHLLVNLPHFHEVHNRALEQYRDANRIRSRTHPVPELEERDGWWEAPFWSWRAGDHRRNHLFARQKTPRTLVLSDGSREIAELPLGPDVDACCAIEVLQEIAADGERLRTRALTTTLFSRMLASDVFIHGIGGAKYDEMTDVILSEFYGIQAPGFMTVSATLRLMPERVTGSTAAELERLERLRRDLTFNADRHLPRGEDPAVDALCEEKRALQQEQREARANGPAVDHARSRWRYRRFRQINRELSRTARSQRDLVDEEISRTRRALAADQIFAGRDYSSCLYPADRVLTVLSRAGGGAAES